MLCCLVPCMKIVKVQHSHGKIFNNINIVTVEVNEILRMKSTTNITTVNHKYFWNQIHHFFLVVLWNWNFRIYPTWHITGGKWSFTYGWYLWIRPCPSKHAWTRQEGWGEMMSGITILIKYPTCSEKWLSP